MITEVYKNIELLGNTSMKNRHLIKTVIRKVMFEFGLAIKSSNRYMLLAAVFTNHNISLGKIEDFT